MSLKQYLDRHAEPEAVTLDRFDHHYQHVLCIPAFAETPAMLDKLTAASGKLAVLVILVVNAPENAGKDKIQNTQALANAIRKKHDCIQRLTDHICLLEGPENTHILLVERCTPGFFLDNSGGVGLARKIACDMACRLFHQGNIDSPWIHTTDADTQLPEEYFSATENLNANNDSAGIYPFQHLPHPDLKRHQALQLYELSLRYYVAGLAWAGSPWAYHTIGSTLVINTEHYARVRGFPKRQAGEDFYLLEKLAKTGNIATLTSAPLLIDNRLSDRVPFGTGPAVLKILAMDKPLEDYRFYHHGCFVALRCWLAHAATLAPEQEDMLSLSRFERMARALNLTLDCALLLRCLKSLGVEKALAHAAANAASGAAFVRHIETWFDAFNTLKFIHWLRDERFPSQPLNAIRDETYLPFAALLSAYDPAPPALTPSPQSPPPDRPADSGYCQ